MHHFIFHISLRKLFAIIPVNYTNAVLEYLEIMPEDKSDVVRRDFNRLLPKEEAAGAVVVGSLSWTFVMLFGIWLVALDMTNLVASAKIMYTHVKAILGTVRVIVRKFWAGRLILFLHDDPKLHTLTVIDVSFLFNDSFLR